MSLSLYGGSLHALLISAFLQKSVESAAARVQALSEELEACQAAQEETERRLRDTKDRDADVKVRVSQLDGEASAMKLRVADLEAERNDQAAALRATQSRLQSSARARTGASFKDPRILK
eukprot:s3422_g3.t1